MARKLYMPCADGSVVATATERDYLYAVVAPEMRFAGRDERGRWVEVPTGSWERVAASASLAGAERAREKRGGYLVPVYGALKAAEAVADVWRLMCEREGRIVACPQNLYTLG